MYWRVTFKRDGSLRAVVPLKGPGHDRWVVVEAETREEAHRRAFNIYCARKKRERNAALKAQGKCACGRPLDGALVEVGRYKGKAHQKCATCRERNETVWRPNHAERIANGTVGQGMAERDEAARIAANSQRQRDRRAEIRLETLLDVRAAWRDAPTVGRFGEWLRGQIEALTGSSVQPSKQACDRSSSSGSPSAAA